MSKSLKIGLGIVAILLLVGIVYVFIPKSVKLGTAVDCTSNTCFTSLGVTGTAQFDGAVISNGAVTNNSTFSLGSGTALSNLIATTCTLGTKGPQSIDSSLNASTTGVYDCPVTGLTSSHTIIAQLATSTRVGTGSSFWSIIGAKASTTAGYAEVLIYNNGPAAVPSATGVGSSTVIFGFK